MERIIKTPGVCGGNACVRDTRVPVWTLQRLRDLGVSDQKLLDDFPSLAEEDLSAVWSYVSRHQTEIRRAIERQGGNGSPAPGQNPKRRTVGPRRAPAAHDRRDGGR